MVGDRLIRVSAVSFGGQSALVTLGSGRQFTSFQRDLIPVTAMDFDTIMGAIASNEGRYGYTDVALELMHTEASVPRAASQQRDRLKPKQPRTLRALRPVRQSLGPEPVRRSPTAPASRPCADHGRNRRPSWRRGRRDHHRP